MHLVGFLHLIFVSIQNLSQQNSVVEAFIHLFEAKVNRNAVSKLISYVTKNTLQHVISGVRYDVGDTCALWDIARRRVVIPYRRFGTNSRSYLLRLTLNIRSLARQRCLSSWGHRRTPWFFFVISQLFDAVDYSNYVFWVSETIIQ